MLTTFVALVMPVIVLLMAAVINVSGVVHAKLMLQNAADRAAYAGAIQQAFIMDDMGAKNREIQGIFQKLSDDIVLNSNNGAEDVAKKVKDATQRIAADDAQLEDWNSTAYPKAEAASLSIVKTNYAAAKLTVRVPNQPMLTLLDNLETNQRQHLKSDYSSMVGGQIWEPESHDHTDNVVQSYYVKDAVREVRWQVELTAPTPHGFMLGQFISPTLHAVAATKPYGSSIRDCGLNASCPAYEVTYVPYQD